MPGHGQSVLVVDDDADVALVSQLHLEAAGFAVSVVGTGQDAVDFCLTTRPLSVVLDFMLPDLDGLQVVKLLNGDPVTAGIPIVMLTARTDERDQKAAWEAGVTEFITKPFDGSRLVEAVRTALKETDGSDREDRRLRAIERLAARDHESSRQLAAIIEGADDAVIAKTLGGRIISWNSGAERLYGWTSGEAVGQSISMLAPPGLDDGIPAILERIAAGERVPSYETERLRKDGRAVLVSLTVSPIKDALGRVIGASAISRDVTERYRVEQRFRSLVEAAPDAIVIVGSNGLIELVNAQTENLFGHPREQLIGQSVEMLVPERYRDRHPEHRLHYAAYPRTRPMGAGLDLFGLRADGSEFPVEISLSPLETDEGVSYAAMMRDVTARKAADTKFRGLLEAAPDAIVGVNATGTIVLVNAQTEALFGYNRDELIGQPVEILVPEALRERHPSHRQHYFDEPRTRAMGEGLDLVARRKDGSEFSAEISLSSIETEDGLLVSTAIRDVTERKRAAEIQAAAIEREREASSRLREVDRLRSDFLSTVSHELRTPLTAIRGFSEILVDSWERTPDERKLEFVERIHAAGARLDYLIEDLLDFTRLERGQLKINLVPVLVDDLVKETLARAGAVLARHTLRVDVPDGLRVLADRTAFIRVLENLLTNAAKFAPAGTEVAIQAVAQGQRVLVSVTDCGIGIPPEHQERVFERFHRVPETAATQPGTGIGLAIVKHFIEAQGGEVSLESEPGQGSRFVLHLQGVG